MEILHALLNLEIPYISYLEKNQIIIKHDNLIFDGQLDPIRFLDWLDGIEYIFD